MCGLDTLVCRGDLDQNALLANTSLLVELYDGLAYATRNSAGGG